MKGSREGLFTAPRTRWTGWMGWTRVRPELAGGEGGRNSTRITRNEGGLLGVVS